jgi:20S proteasome alpha/beta subunit
VSGLIVEAAPVIAFARKLCEQYRSIYSSPIPIEKLCSDIADALHQLTLSSQSRPLAVNLLVAGSDDQSQHIYTVDPEGSYRGWKASAIGYNNVKLLDELYSVRSDFPKDEEPLLEEVAWKSLVSQRAGSSIILWHFIFFIRHRKVITVPSNRETQWGKMIF